jgi:hypothetical protein
MGRGLRWFIVEDDETVARVRGTTCARWFEGAALPASRGGRDLKLLEVVVDVDRTTWSACCESFLFGRQCGTDGST